MDTDFNDPKIGKEYNFPLAGECCEGFLGRAKERILMEYLKRKEYAYREVCPRLVRQRNGVLKAIERGK